MGTMRTATALDAPSPDRRTLLATPAQSPAVAAVAGVVFDVADVLYDASLWRRWLWRLVGHMGLPVEYAAFYGAWDARYRGDVHCGRREYAEALESFLLEQGLSWAQVDEVEAASRVQRQCLEPPARALPGVGWTIAQLAERRFPMVAWNDAPYPAAKAAELLHRLGLANRFGAVLSSFDLECTQPDAECYALVLERLALPADRVIYVGHDAAHLAGARSAGLRTVAFNFQPPSQADFYLARFEDLLSIVDARPTRQIDSTSERRRSRAA